MPPTKNPAKSGKYGKFLPGRGLEVAVTICYTEDDLPRWAIAHAVAAPYKERGRSARPRSFVSVRAASYGSWVIVSTADSPLSRLSVTVAFRAEPLAFFWTPVMATCFLLFADARLAVNHASLAVIATFPWTS